MVVPFIPIGQLHLHQLFHELSVAFVAEGRFVPEHMVEVDPQRCRVAVFVDAIVWD